MVTSKTRIFKREIVFTRLPLTGTLKYKDIFQLFPADLKGMPTTKVAFKHYPLILEFWYTEDELAQTKVDDLFLEIEDLHRLSSVIYRKVDLFLGLLSVVTTHQFFTYRSSESRWGFPILDENASSESNKWSSKWCLELFMWPELPEQLKINGFTDMSLVRPRVLPWNYYYSHPNFDEKIESEIKFSNITLQFFDAYFETASETRKVLDSAIASANTSMEFMSTRMKLALLSAFTAIETMVNFETKDFNLQNVTNVVKTLTKSLHVTEIFYLNTLGIQKLIRRNSIATTNCVQELFILAKILKRKNYLQKLITKQNLRNVFKWPRL